MKDLIRKIKRTFMVSLKDCINYLEEKLKNSQNVEENKIFSSILIYLNKVKHLLDDDK